MSCPPSFTFYTQKNIRSCEVPLMGSFFLCTEHHSQISLELITFTQAVFSTSLFWKYISTIFFLNRSLFSSTFKELYIVCLEHIHPPSSKHSSLHIHHLFLLILLRDFIFSPSIASVVQILLEVVTVLDSGWPYKMKSEWMPENNIKKVVFSRHNWAAHHMNSHKCEIPRVRGSWVSYLPIS